MIKSHMEILNRAEKTKENGEIEIVVWVLELDDYAQIALTLVMELCKVDTNQWLVIEVFADLDAIETGQIPVKLKTYYVDIHGTIHVK